MQDVMPNLNPKLGEQPSVLESERNETRTSKAFAASKEAIEKFQAYAHEEYLIYKADREDIDAINNEADAMYSCMRNKSFMASLRKKDIGIEKDTRSSVGSVLFHRQVNALASQMVAVMKSSPDLWRYVPVYNEGRPVSDQDAKAAADNANALARWIRRKDRFDEKIPEFAVSVFKNSNIPVMIQFKTEYKLVRATEPVYEAYEDPETGEISSRVVGERKVVKRVSTGGYPSVVFPHWSMVYADRYIPDMEQQNCIIVLSFVTKAELQSEAKDGYIDEDAVRSLDAKHEWDGSEGSAAIQDEARNRDRSFTPRKGRYLRWDVYARVPINENGEWDEESDLQIWWGTFIGNSLDSAVPVAFSPNPDPDGEMPIRMISCMPDGSNELYHTTTAEVVRSLYSADATLLNLAIDNMANVNDPPMLIVDGQHRIRDFTFKKGQRWHVDNINAVKMFEIRDTTVNTIGLREQVRDDAKIALATDPSMMGEYAGARTSATEYMDVARNTKGPHLVRITYILNQLLPWMARKYISYAEAYMPPDQYVQIVDAEKQYRIRVGDAIGDFDVVVEIVDEYQRMEMMQREINQIMQIIGGVPYFQQSPSHTTDAGELLRLWLGVYKFNNVSRIVLPSMGVDAENAAMARINAMLNHGIYQRPQPGENHNIHMRVAQAERLRWRGLENSDDPRARNLPLLDQYINELKFMIQQGAAVSALQQGLLGETLGGAIGQQAAPMLGQELANQIPSQQAGGPLA